MKTSADKGKLEDGYSTLRPRKTSSKNSEIEPHLSTRYEFRYNTVLGRTEYRSKNDVHFSKVGRYEINTFRREIDNDIGIITSSDNLYSIIESSFSPRINPIQEYFKNFPSVDLSSSSSFSLKAIPGLASCVAVRNSDKWLPYLTKWLVAVVANAMDDRDCRNHTCLVLTGEQGKFKTTFLDLLCPPALHGYSYTGKIYPQEKDTLPYIGQNLIVNIDDQLKALNKRDENKLKNLITCPMVKYRMPYEKYVRGIGERQRLSYRPPQEADGSCPLKFYLLTLRVQRVYLWTVSMRKPKPCSTLVSAIGLTMMRYRNYTGRARSSKCRPQKRNCCYAASRSQLRIIPIAPI